MVGFLRTEQRQGEVIRTTPFIHLARFDLERDIERDFLSWYQADHIPRMLARRGWRRMSCYRCSDGHPIVSIYDLDGLGREVISEAPFRDPRFASRGLRNYHARTWRQIFSAGEWVGSSPWLNVVTVDVVPVYADAFSRWYNEVHVPEILGCPGWLAGRRYECVDGEPRFLAIYDLSDGVTPFQSREWESAVGWDAHVDHIRGFHGFRTYELMFEVSATS
jgi:hypothetical protein